MEPPPKKPRMRPSTTKITFAATSPLVSIVQAVANLSSIVTFGVNDNEIATQTVGDSKSCMVSAKLTCCVTRDADITSEVFSVDARTLLRAIKSVQTYSLTIEYDGSSPESIRIEAHDEVTRSCAMTWNLPTVVEDAFSVELDTINYVGEWLYDAKTLKADIQRCCEMDCEDSVMLRLGHVMDTEQTDKVLCRRVHLIANGSRGNVAIQHESCTETAGDCTFVTPLDGNTTQCDEQTVYSQTYCMTHILEFLRCTDSSSVKLLLGNEQPLIVEVPLMGNNSTLAFVQGPQVA